MIIAHLERHKIPRSMKNLLVVEGNTVESRALHMKVGGTVASEGYAQLLRHLCPDARTHIVFPADSGAQLPDGIALADFDGAALTGSALHVAQATPEVTRQIEFARAMLAADIPIFGSCWGLQVLTVAAGGAVRRNPRGRELGFGRNIVRTPHGLSHAMYEGKPPAFTAVTVHLDEVETLPAGASLLASNGFSHVQALDFGRPAAVWGVQYHPEYPLREIAAIMRRTPTLVAEGFFHTEAEKESCARDFDLLDRHPNDHALAWRMGVNADVIDAGNRTREILNWISHGVAPFAARRATASPVKATTP